MREGEQNMNFKFSVFSAYHDGESLWFTAVEYNALYRMFLKNSKLEYIGSFPNERFLQWRLYTSVHMYNNKLYFIPGSAREIGIYDMETREFSKVSIGIEEKDNDVSDIRYAKKFASAFFVDDVLIMLPCCYNQVVSYDLKSGVIRKDSSLYEGLWEKYAETINCSEKAFYVCWNAKKIDKYKVVFDLHSNTNGYVVYDLLSHAWQDYKAGYEGGSYNYCEYANGKVWLYDDKQMMLVSQDMGTGEFEKYNLPDINETDKFSNMIFYDNCIYFVLFSGRKMLRFSLQHRNFELVEELSDESMSFSNMFTKSEEGFFLYDISKRCFVHEANGKLFYYPCNIDEFTLTKFSLKAYREQRKENGLIFFENEDFKLNDYLLCIKNDSPEDVDDVIAEKSLDNRYGKMIMDRILAGETIGDCVG